MTVSVARSRVGIAALALSAAGFVSVVLNEDYTSTAVIPIPGDVPTIGFGTIAGVHLGDRTTPPKALVRALSDMAKYEGAVKRCIHVPLFQYEYDASTSLAYNIGTTAFCNSTVVKRFNAGDYAGGCAAFSMWDKANGRVVPGLANRRARERAMCEGKT
jgi:lysozyme